MKNRNAPFGIFISAVLLAFAILAVISFSLQGQRFIVRDGQNLYIEGTDQRFRFLGGNHFNLLVKYLYGSFYDMTGQEVFDISSQYNISVIRFWATCSDSYFSDQCLYSGPNNWNSSKSEFFGKFDELVRDAGTRGIYLIPVLSDGYNAFSRMGGEVCDVGSGANLEYKRFVSDLVGRYKDSPTILIWEIGNEGSLHCSNFYHLLQWYQDTSDFISRIDHRHIISTGENNLGTLSTESFDAVHLSGNISIASVHIYDTDLYNLENRNDYAGVADFISLWTTESHSFLNKPVYFGEFGSYNISQDPGFYGNFMTAAFYSDVDGIVAWSWLEGEECQRPASVGGICITPSRTPEVAEEIHYWADKFKQGDMIDKNALLVSFIFIVILPIFVVWSTVISNLILEERNRKFRKG